jgi:hypothetical protein
VLARAAAGLPTHLQRCIITLFCYLPARATCLSKVSRRQSNWNEVVFSLATEYQKAVIIANIVYSLEKKKKIVHDRHTK